jgi:hypothetical protein
VLEALMPAMLIGGLVAAGVLAEAAHVGSVNGGTLLLAVGAGAATSAAVRWFRRESGRTDRLVAAALYPQRQADRDERIIATANRAQVRL